MKICAHLCGACSDHCRDAPAHQLLGGQQSLPRLEKRTAICNVQLQERARQAAAADTRIDGLHSCICNGEPLS